MTPLYLLTTIVFTYAAVFTVYYFIFSLAGLVGTRARAGDGRQRIGRFAVLIPVYKEDAVIVATVKNALEQNYPASKYIVVVAFEGLKPDTVDQLRQLPIQCVELTGGKNSKAIALQKSLDKVEDADYVLVLDADNLMDKNCLHHLNKALQNGYVAVQGHRVAKNTNNNLAMLDGISEEINNHIFRRGHRALSFSSALIGSGMAFDMSYFKTIINGITNIWEDRELEMRILLDGQKIEFVEDAFIYDEKVDNQRVLFNQRGKWFCGQFVYAFKNVLLLPRALLRGKVDVVNKIVQGFAPPLSIFLVLLSSLSIFGIATGNNQRWVLLGIIFLLAVLMALPYRRFKFKILKACVQLPMSLIVLVVAFFGSVFKMQTHYHTPHYHKSVSMKNLV